MEVANRLNGIGEYYFSQKLREIDELNKQGKNIINLGIGSPDLPPHPLVIEELNAQSAKPNVHSYQSYKGSAILRGAIASWYEKWYGVSLNPDTEILPLIGSKEGNMHICMTYLNAGDVALVPNPGYPTYKSNVLLTGASCIEYELNEENQYYPDIDELEKLDLSKAKLMFVNYPHMPTGQLPHKEVLEKLVAFAKRHDILIVHDNPYSFILNENPQSILSINGAKEVAIELNSLSKSHNMAGWRVGMLVGDSKRINEILRFKSNMDSGMYLPVQLAAAKALTLGKEWHDELNAVYRERRYKVFEFLDLLKCKYAENQVGLFVWAKASDTHKDGFDLSDDILYNANVFITPGGIFGSKGNDFIRISLCSPIEKYEESIHRIKQSQGNN